MINYQRNKQLNYEEKLNMQSQFQEELLRTQIEIQEQTLKTMSQEIHDNIGQVLSLAKLNLNTFGDNQDQETKTKISDTRQLVSKAITDLRDLSRSMYAEKITELGFQEAITNELKILQNSRQYETELKVTGQAYKLEPQKEMILFRIVQEAINNTLKHAKAKKIIANLNYEVEFITLRLSDDGTGFDPKMLAPGKTGIGFKSMQSRITLVGGKLTIDSSPGNGTAITINLPKNK
jgi:signal transduction histidine kinase